jgi:hypothetical protein
MLLPCPSCDRHIMKSERACPFCGVALTLIDSAGGPLPAGRLGRAARFAWGAAVAGTLVVTGCGGDDDGISDSGVVTDGGGSGMDSGFDSGAVFPPYGTPPDDGGGGGDDGGVAVDDAGADADGGVDDGGTSAALYGAPPEA